jgi:hypothetical protein
LLVTENRLFSVINWAKAFPADVVVAPEPAGGEDFALLPGLRGWGRMGSAATDSL